MRATFPLAIGTFAIGITEFVIMGLLPNVAHDLHINIAQAGWLITSYALGVVFGAPLLTIALRKVDARLSLASLILAFALANLLTVFTSNFSIIILTRFLAGLPHGTYFGISAVVASRLYPAGKESQGVAAVFAGLTVANLIGVPAGTWLGQHYGWQVAFGFVAVVAMIAAVTILIAVPSLDLSGTSTVKEELSVLRNRQFLRVMGIAMIGFGGMFAGFSYITPMITHIAGISEQYVTPLMMLSGAGMVIGNTISGKLVAGRPLQMTRILLTALAIMCALLSLSAHTKWLFIPVIFLFTTTGFALPTAIQMLTIKLSRGAEALAAATNHSAFNIGNALGAFLGGLPIAAGLGVDTAPWVGVALALTGLAIACTIKADMNQ